MLSLLNSGTSAFPTYREHRHIVQLCARVHFADLTDFTDCWWCIFTSIVPSIPKKDMVYQSWWVSTREQATFKNFSWIQPRAWIKKLSATECKWMQSGLKTCVEAECSGHWMHDIDIELKWRREKGFDDICGSGKRLSRKIIWWSQCCNGNSGNIFSASKTDKILVMAQSI